MATITKTATMTPELFSWAQKNPSEINFLKPNAFRMMIKSLPLVTYFIQSAQLPEISLGVAMQATPLVDIPHPGDKMVYDPLTVTFKVQESLEDYNELYMWITGLGFDLNSNQFTDYVNAHSTRLVGINPAQSEMPQFSDATLVVLDALNNPVASFNFIDCFPIMLSGLRFEADVDQVPYFSATATFKYLAFTFAPITF